jgi:hypothetical protein
VNVPGRPGADPLLVRYERRQRELVQADFHVFAADHWNFNVRFPNPGGNHGSFFRISTHSAWMLAGAGVPTKVVQEPYDSLNFAPTILSLVGKAPPMPDRVVALQGTDSAGTSATDRRYQRSTAETVCPHQSDNRSTDLVNDAAVLQSRRPGRAHHCELDSRPALGLQELGGCSRIQRHTRSN